MNISIIGPEDSGKSTLAQEIAKNIRCGREVYFCGMLKSGYANIPLEKFHEPRNAVVILDDTNAFVENYDLFKKDNHLKEPVIMSKHYNRVNIFVFHSEDDAVKFFFRQSRYIFVSHRYRDSTMKNNKFIKGIQPKTFGRRKWFFDSYKRY